MATKVDALVKNFLKTDGEALCLVLGQRLYLKRGTEKTIVGREGLSEESFRAIADELSPGDLMESLIETSFRMPYRLDDATDPVEIQFGTVDGNPAMTVTRTVPLPERPAPPEPQAGRTEAARSSTQAQPVPTAPTKAAGTAASTTASRPIDRVLLRMLAATASDIHLSAGTIPCFRVHGDIVPQTELGTFSSEAIEQFLDPVFPAKNRREFAERNDTDFAYEIEGVSRFRVNVFRDRRGVGAVFRQIPLEILSAEVLNLPPTVVQFGELQKGLVLVTGPTGSGKSTTLAAIIDHINETRTDHIITIEDPIEFVHPNKKCLVNQREVGGHTRSFKDALRAALREDPDIVLVGEMRDLETVAIAIETAETGHLVFGTLHTTTAASTIDRLIDQFPEDRQAQIRVMLADCLKGVVAQTLLKKKGGGRVAALEILLVNNAIANLIRDGKTFQIASVMQTSRGSGMQLLNDALVELVRKGVVEPREAYFRAVDRPGLLAALKHLNVPGIAELTRESGSPSPAPAGAGASAR